MEQFVVVILWLLGQSFFVSQVIDFLKRADFVKNHPKLVAAILNGIILTIGEFAIGVPGEVIGFLTALVTAFLGSIGSHEVTDAALDRKRKEAAAGVRSWEGKQ